LLRESGHILLEATPRSIRVSEVITAIKATAPEIRDVRHVHIWEITSKMHAMTAHIVVKDCKVSEIKIIIDKINVALDKKFYIVHTNFQFECDVK
jgi:cobalt-zinc-cadmium efflux system protein